MTRCLLLVMILACLLAACAPGNLCGSQTAPLLCLRPVTTMIIFSSVIHNAASLPGSGAACADLGPSGCISRLEARR